MLLVISADLARAQLPTRFASRRRLANDCTQRLLSGCGPRVVGPVTDVPGSALPRFCDPRCPGSAVSLREVLASALSASARSEVSLREVMALDTSLSLS